MSRCWGEWEDRDDDFRFRLPDESEDESWLRLSGEVDLLSASRSKPASFCPDCSLTGNGEESAGP